MELPGFGVNPAQQVRCDEQWVIVFLSGTVRGGSIPPRERSTSMRNPGEVFSIPFGSRFLLPAQNSQLCSLFASVPNFHPWDQGEGISLDTWRSWVLSFLASSFSFSESPEFSSAWNSSLFSIEDVLWSRLTVVFYSILPLSLCPNPHSIHIWELNTEGISEVFFVSSFFFF